MSSAADMARAFEYVSDVFRTCATMLLSADVPLAESGFIPYTGWYATYPTPSAKCADHTDWVPTFLSRHYYRLPRKDREVLTVAASLWGHKPRLAKESLAICSFMRVEPKVTAGSDVYKWAMVQRWCESAPPDGDVREIRVKAIRFEGDEKSQFESDVTGKTVLSAALPLSTITNTGELMSRLVKHVVDKVPTN